MIAQNILMYAREADAADYISRYLDCGRFEALCRECPNYGRRWGCPPLDAGFIHDYRHVRLFALKIDIKPTPGDTGAAEAMMKVIQDVRGDYETRLLALERDLGGRAALFTGMCPHCGSEECARTSGKPCRHPDLVRPSLEALGFDLTATAADYFGIELKWSSRGEYPPYLCLIGGVFY